MIGPGIAAAGLVVAAVTGSIGCSGGSASKSADSTETTETNEPSRIDEAEIARSLDAAEQYFNAGDHANARVILSRLVRDAPDVLAARELLGQVYAAEAASHEQAGRNEAAAEARASAWEQYQRAVQVAPQQAGLHHSAALMALAAGEREAAIELLHKATRLDRSNPQYPLYLSQLLIQDGRLDDAESLIQEAILLDPDEPHLRATLGAISLERGNFDTALDHVREARAIAPDDTAFRVQEAKVLRRSGRPRDGLTLLVSLRENELVREFVAWEIAACYEELGEPIAAAQAWERCFRADPLHIDSWLWAVRIGEALVEAGRTAEASMWLLEAKQRNGLAEEVLALEQAIEDAEEGGE